MPPRYVEGLWPTRAQNRKSKIKNQKITSMPFASIEDAAADVRDGRMIIIVDDEDRENEGDLVCAAEKVTPEVINFMARYARGLICMPLTEERCEIGRASCRERV